MSAELVAAVKEHALSHYNDGGWDFVVECWSDEDIAKEVANCTTPAEAIEVFAGYISVIADRQADADFHATESYCGFQGTHDWCYYPPKHEGDTHSDGTRITMRTPDGYPR